MITSADNPKVKQARALLEHRGRLRHGQCLIEGVRLIEDAIGAGVVPALVFYVAGADDSPRIRALLHELAEAHVPCWETSRAVFDSLSDTTVTQGVVAVAPIPRLAPSARPGLVLVLDQVRDPGNLGTILRGASAAGVDDVLLCSGCADPWSPKVLRAGMGAHFRLAVATDMAWPAVASRVAELRVWLADARGEHLYDQVDWTLPSALIACGETTGASDQALKLSAGRVRIPMPGGAESLNVAMATTVLLFEAVRQRLRQTES